MQDLARQSNAAVVFPYYTPAPEAQYPKQFEQTYGVLEHMVENGPKFNLRTETFGLAGDSVGGKLTSSTPQCSLLTPKLMLLN